MSYWLRHCAAVASSPQLPLEPCDVAIVGAGISGVSTAFWLRRLGFHGSITLVDKRGVGCGASGRNGGHLWPESGSHFEQRCTAAIVECARELGVATHMRGSVYLVFSEAERRNEEPMGPNEQWWDRERLAHEIPALRTKGKGAVWGGFYCPSAGRMSAHDFVRAMYAAIEDTVVLELACVARETETGALLMRDGRTLQARRVVYATNAWLHQLTGLPVKAVRGQVLHAIIPEHKRFPYGLAWNDDYQYLVPSDDGGVVFGGASLCVCVCVRGCIANACCW